MAKSTGQHRARRRAARGGRLATGAALRADLGPLPRAAQLDRRLAAGRGRGGRAARCAAQRRWPRTREARDDDPTLPAVLDAMRAGFEAGARRRPQRLRGARRAVRRRARAQPPDRRALAVDRRRGARRGRDPRARRRPGRDRAGRGGPRARAAGAARRSGPRRAPRATGRPPTGCATSSSPAASRSRTPATASAGGSW